MSTSLGLIGGILEPASAPSSWLGYLPTSLGHLYSIRSLAAVFYTVDTAADYVSRLARVATSASYGTRTKVERALRDIHDVNAAVDSFQSVRRTAGGVLLGQEPQHPVF